MVLCNLKRIKTELPFCHFLSKCDLNRININKNTSSKINLKLYCSPFYRTTSHNQGKPWGPQSPIQNLRGILAPLGHSDEPLDHNINPDCNIKKKEIQTGSARSWDGCFTNQLPRLDWWNCFFNVRCPPDK